MASMPHTAQMEARLHGAVFSLTLKELLHPSFEDPDNLGKHVPFSHTKPPLGNLLPALIIVVLLVLVFA